jgi:hypothetical protein
MSTRSNYIILSNPILSLFAILFSVGIEESMAQQFTTSPYLGSEKELIVDFPKPYCQGNWSNESLAQIKKLIKEYGTPDEITPTSLLWEIPGDIPKTILFTEYFLYLPSNVPKKTNYCKISKLVSHR